MIGIKMKPNIPVHYQKGEHITEGLPPIPNIQPTAGGGCIIFDQIIYCKHIINGVVDIMW